MSDPFFVSIEAQESFFLVLRIIFCVSIVLHSISLIFLIKLTPPNQGTWRNYMLFVQGCLIAIDVYMEMLFVMVPLFPAPCGYCTGPLCKIGVPLQIQTGIGFFLIAELSGSILLCVFHRHQSILVAANPFRLKPKWRTVVQVSLVAGSIFPPTYFAANLQTQSVTDEMVRADPRNLTWIMERGCYICLKKIFYHEIFVVQVFLLLLVTTIWLVFMFIHMNRVLNSDKGIRSSQTSKNIRKSVKILFFQLITPLSLMAIPATIIIVALAADGLITFEQSMFVFMMMLCHPIVHNILLLTLTPSYRSKIINVLQKILICERFGRAHSNQATPSVVPHETTKNRLGQSSFMKI